MARVGRRQRRRVLRAGVLGPVRAVLALGRARRDRRPDAVSSTRATWPARCWRPRPSRPARCIDAMNADSGVPLTALKVDGGMVVNELLMQFQADILGVPVIRPVVAETTALGAAYAAGLAVGLLDRRGRHPHQLGEGQGVDAVDGRRRPREDLRPVEEGRDPHLRLGRVAARLNPPPTPASPPFRAACPPFRTGDTRSATGDSRVQSRSSWRIRRRPASMIEPDSDG